ncbi:MAG: hypothetical protein ACE5I3_00500 [Phycisphaerae bacterium]
MLYRRSVRNYLIGLAGAILAVNSAVAQTLWYVDDDAPNDPGPGDPTVSDPLEDGSAEHPFDAIQEGIDAAVDGDTVLVLDGTYAGLGNKNLDFGGRLITVRSENGPDTCIIDCEGQGRGFYFHSGETADAVVDGFTITKGDSPGGSGVLCSESSPTITGCNITGGTTAWAGGGICCVWSTTVIANCAITENTAEWSGGGVYSELSDVRIVNCLIAGNRAQDFGGGVSGGFSGNAAISNCTIVGNDARSDCAAGVSSRGETTIANCVLWGNTPFEIRDCFGTMVVRYSDIQGSWPGLGNIDADPLFVDPDGPDDDPSTWEDNDYRLAAGSPCIDAGCNCGVLRDVADLDGDGDTDEYTPFDLDGEGRFFDDPATEDTGSGLPPIVDMGAYEFGGSDPSPCRGDLDGDRDVDWDDLTVLLENYGTLEGATGVDGDMDCDGDVELSDLAKLLSVYGTICE